MSISGILFLVITIAVLLGCAAVFAVYMILYRKRLNSALYTDMKQGAKGMAAPWVILSGLIVFAGGTLVTLALLGGLFKANLSDKDKGGLSMNNTGGAESGYTGGIDIGPIDFRAHPADLVKNTLIGDYTPGDDIKGYTKYEHTDGDIRFIYYADTSGCGIMPSLLIYTEYTGSGRVVTADNNIHVDNIEWSGKEFDIGGIITEKKESWFSVNNFFITGSMVFTQTVETEDDAAHTGSVKIDMEEAFRLSERYPKDSDGEYYATSTAE